ncbi:anti-sigma factor [Microbacterium sp. cx-55]|uniref:anti-sigma factor n=1 Tax=Microbacterium sp. cx-55 TaxID=2875948 RepID=UPI001CBC9310|nr:anti-sigma factor [Microbacterium sp. cx-55]MBZ4488118.1 anti-sigma factor [Microbacterium sp. cx-55]UGB34472.1 anti-sigma factor [Microbacterium sp. cx-55]
MNDREFDELSAGDAVHALTPDDQRMLARALEADPQRRATLDEDATMAARLADGVSEVVPPPAIRAELLARIAVTPQDAAPAATSAAADPVAAPAATAPEPAPAARGGWGMRSWFALAASLVLILGIGGAVVVVSQQVTQPASVVALERITDAPDAQSAAGSVTGGGEATLHWSESVGSAVLVSEGLPSIDEGKEFELWYVRDGQPIAAGVFSADGGDATAVLDGSMQPGDVIAVTVEDAGGSPNGVPTSDAVLAIATA